MQGISTPIELAYLIKEQKIFWINRMKELFMLDMPNANRTKLLDLRGEAVSLTVDWLERCLYYVLNNKNRFGSQLFKLDLNRFDIRSIVVREHAISEVQISPYTR